MRLVVRTLAGGETELLLRDGYGPERFEVRAQHHVYAKAQELLYQKALAKGVDQDVAHDTIFASV